MLVISGKSATGKDTVVTELVNNYDYNKLITYTTRPMREGERDGIDYHFITVEDFLKKYIDGFFLEVKYFTTQSGIWFYGSSIEDYREADDKTLVILTPDGVRKLSERNIPYKGFLIDISDEEIKRRQKLRGDMSTPEKAAEAERRFKKGTCWRNHFRTGRPRAEIQNRLNLARNGRDRCFYRRWCQ